jgi:NAD(P)-dependent dehydrogenase (short-subunit alcohol dehydrogenase family)
VPITTGPGIWQKTGKMSGDEPRVAIVTGGASGIGRAISERLAWEETIVAIFDRDGGAAESVAKEITQKGGVAASVTVDVTNRAEIDEAVRSVGNEFGVVTVLVNNAGVSAFQPFLEIATEDWDRQIAVNLTGTFLCCQAVLPGMVEAGWGRIVNISSSSVHSGSRRQAHYVAAKSGVVGLTKVLALEFGPYGITVNTIPPGFIDTPMLRQADADGVLSIEAQTAATPVGRPGRPEDIAAACAFLVSDEAGYITGQILGVNGGRNT